MEQTVEEVKKKVRHVWCNRDHSDGDECKMCRILYEKYPMDDKTSYTDMLMKHFPSVVERK